MPEDIEEAAGTTETATAVEDSSYSDILKGQATEPSNPEASAKTEEKTNPELEKEPPQTLEEILLELDGKDYPVRKKDLLEYLSNQSKFSEREKSLLEKEKSLNRDYTQKSQQVAELRKSLESAFGGKMPETWAIKAFGAMYQKSSTNPEYAAALNAMMEGKSVREALSTGANSQGPGKEVDPYVSQLQQEIAELREQLGSFTNSFTEREEAQVLGEAQKSWQSWVSQKEKAGIKITDDIDATMTPFITALKAAHPDWDNNQILDEAYKHATIGDLEKNAASKVLQSVDKAKKATLPKIKPKSSAQPDSEKSYKDIFLGR